MVNYIQQTTTTTTTATTIIINLFIKKIREKKILKNNEKITPIPPIVLYLLGFHLPYNKRPHLLRERGVVFWKCKPKG